MHAQKKIGSVLIALYLCIISATVIFNLFAVVYSNKAALPQVSESGHSGYIKNVPISNIPVQTPHFFELSIKNIQTAKSQYRDSQSRYYASDLQSKSNFVPSVVYGSVALFGAIIFGYFYWQAHYNFRFSLGFFLSLAGLGLLIFLYGFYKTVECLFDAPDKAACSILYSQQSTDEYVYGDSRVIVQEVSCDEVDKKSVPLSTTKG